MENITKKNRLNGHVLQSKLKRDMTDNNPNSLFDTNHEKAHIADASEMEDYGYNLPQYKDEDEDWPHIDKDEDEDEDEGEHEGRG